MVAPKLRFQEFDDAWNKKRLDSFLERISNPVDVVADQQYTQIGIRSHGKGIFHKGSIDGKELGNKRVFWIEPNTLVVNIVFAWERAIAVTSDSEKGMIASHRFPMYLPKNNLSNVNFLRYFFVTNKGQKYLELASPGGAGRNKTLGQSNFAELKIDLPSLKEQTKIANFLSAVDEKIAQLSQKLHLLGQYKQGMMQKLFYQQIRFKADDGSEFGEWEIQPLNHYLYTSKLKNKDLTYTKYDVLSVSGEFGIVNQINLLGRSYAGVSVAPYGIVEVNDVVYTKSPLKSNPYGIIKVNQGKAGIVSTLYAVYKCKENIIPKLIEYYFQNDLKLNQLLKPLVKKGAKNDMKVNNDHVLTGKISFPASLEEQTKIANFLSAIDQKIDVVSEQLKQAKIWKKGLLQQMFV